MSSVNENIIKIKFFAVEEHLWQIELVSKENYQMLRNGEMLTTARTQQIMHPMALQQEAFTKCKDWINGPQYLLVSEEQWLKPPECLESLRHEDPEVRKVKVTVNIIQAATLDYITALLHHYSTWTWKLSKAVA